MAVWQEAYGSARHTQSLFFREFGINKGLDDLAPTRRTLYTGSATQV